MLRLVVIVCLVAIGSAWLYLPMCACSTKAKAYVAAMKSDLRNLVTAQETFYADSGRYATTLDELAYSNSTDVTVTLHSWPDGWRGVATHARSESVCHLDIGPDADGEPECLVADD